MNKTHFACVALALLAGSFGFAADEPAKEELKDIPYKVVEEWGPSGALLGAGYAIVIDPKNRSEKDMKRLGELLKEKHGKDKRAYVFIYDNAKAATMRKQIPEKGAAATFYDKHLIGFYVKNAGRMHDYWFGISSKGVQGKITEIKYE